MADPAPPRHRIQFSLRTLMIVVTLLAVPCAYVGWQAKIVRERDAILASIKNAGGEYILAEPSSAEIFLDLVFVNDGKPLLQQITKGREASQPSMLRRWLGDVAVMRINTRDSRIELEAIRCFPEADIYAPEDAATGRAINRAAPH